MDLFQVSAGGESVRVVAIPGIGVLEVFDRRWVHGPGRPPGVMPRACCLWCRQVVPVRRDGFMVPHGPPSARCPLWLMQRYPGGRRILLEGALGGTPEDLPPAPRQPT